VAALARLLAVERLPLPRLELVCVGVCVETAALLAVVAACHRLPHCHPNFLAASTASPTPEDYDRLVGEPRLIENLRQLALTILLRLPRAGDISP